MELIYKQLTTDDFEKCAQQFILAFQQVPWNETWTIPQAMSRFHEIMSCETARGFVIYHEDEVVSTLCGRLMTYMNEKEFWIDDLSVHPHYQGHGIGKKMLAYAKEQLKKDDVARLMLNTMRGYQCQAFYQQQGFLLEENMIIMSYKVK